MSRKSQFQGGGAGQISYQPLGNVYWTFFHWRFVAFFELNGWYEIWPAPPTAKIGFFVTFRPVYHSVFGNFFYFLDPPTMLNTAFRDIFTIITGRTRTSFALFYLFYTCFFYYAFFGERFDFTRNFSEYLLGSKSPPPLLYGIFFRSGQCGGGELV